MALSTQVPPRHDRARLRAITALLLLASLLIGLAHIALLPPFEGFDETAHYSYVQQVATTGRWPTRGHNMSKDIDDYLKVAPTTEKMHGPWTYHRFFAAGSDTIARAREFIHDRPAAARAFTRGQIGNWQAQHPPLYYYALAPAYLISADWGLSTQLFLLRTLSYLFAWVGLGIVAVAAFRRRAQGALAWLSLAVAAWPLLFPMWFPEMGRLGNDSLVTVFSAWAFLLTWSATSCAGIRSHTLLGAVMGLAVLTKATFLPVAAAILALLAIQAWSVRGQPDERSRRLRGLCITVIVLLGVSAWWYVLKFMETGDVIGSHEGARMREAGGMIAGLMKNLDVKELVRTPWVFAMSFLWSSTWSFVLPPPITYLPFVVMNAIMAYGVFRSMRQQSPQAILWLPIVVLGFLFFALSYYSLVTLSTGTGTSPAWYLHAMAPILALLIATGAAEAMRTGVLGQALTALWLYPLVFYAAATLMNLLYFAGCAPKLPGRLYFAWSSAAECLADAPRMYANLSALTLSTYGIALLVVGWSIAVVAMIMAVKALRVGAIQTGRDCAEPSQLQGYPAKAAASGPGAAGGAGRRTLD